MVPIEDSCEKASTYLDFAENDRYYVIVKAWVKGFYRGELQ